MTPFVCPACGGADAVPWCTADDPTGRAPGPWTLVRCAGCGCGALHPAPDDAALARAYAGDYGPHGTPRSLTHAGPARRVPGGPPGRALVVGAGGGANCAWLAAAGWAAIGIEPDAGAVATAVAAGHDVRVGSAEVGPFPAGPFDLVWLPAVLEHIRDPLAALRSGAALLGPAGRLVVWTQNPDGRSARRYGADWVHLDPPRHLWHFGAGALRRLAERAGLRLVRLRSRSRPRGRLASAEIRATRAGRPRALRRSRWRKALTLPACWWDAWTGAGDQWEAECRAPGA